jgi:hypothetical protein
LQPRPNPLPQNPYYIPGMAGMFGQLGSGLLARQANVQAQNIETTQKEARRILADRLAGRTYTPPQVEAPRKTGLRAVVNKIFPRAMGPAQAYHQGLGAGFEARPLDEIAQAAGATLPVPEKMELYERKIRDTADSLMRNGAVDNRQDALDLAGQIVRGDIDNLTNPVTGQNFTINRVTGEITPITPPGGPFTPPSTLPPSTERPSSTLEREETLLGNIGAFGVAESAQEFYTSTFQQIGELLDDIPEGTPGKGVLTAIGKIGEGFLALSPEDQRSRSQFRLMREMVIAALRSSGRPSLVEQQRILELLPKTWESEKTARQNLTALYDILEIQKQTDVAIANNESISREIRKEAMDAAISINMVQQLIGRPSVTLDGMSQNEASKIIADSPPGTIFILDGEEFSKD